MVRAGGLGVPLDDQYLVIRIARLAREAFDAPFERFRVVETRNDD